MAKCHQNQVKERREFIYMQGYLLLLLLPFTVLSGFSSKVLFAHIGTLGKGVSKALD